FRESQGHENLSVESSFDQLMPPMVSQIEGFSSTLLDDSHSVSTALEIFPPGLQEFPVRVENDDCVLCVRVDKNPPLRIADDASMGITVAHSFWKLTPTLDPFIRVRSRT